MGSRYSDEEKARALRELLKSAARSPDSEPNYTRVAADLGIARATLRDWWAHRTETATEAQPEPGVAAPPTDYTPWALEQLGATDPDDRDVKLVLGLRSERDNTSSDTARASLTKHLTEVVLELRKGTEVPAGPITPDQWKAEAQAMPELLLEAVLECDQVLADPRLRAAVGGARG